MKSCPKCNEPHTNQGTFCSRKCANSRVRTKEIRQKVSAALKGRKVGGALVKRLPDPNKKEERACKKCQANFTCFKSSTRVICSRKCSGGYREGSGRAKSGYYKGIYCGSTYELAWVIFNLDHGTNFTRFSGFLEEGGLKYYPDFFLPSKNTIVEIKGYHQDSVDAKSDMVRKLGYSIDVLYKNDLAECFRWVTQNYGVTDDLQVLYDDHKPKYEYVCSWCAGRIVTEKIRKSTEVYCTKVCSGRGNRKKFLESR